MPFLPAQVYVFAGLVALAVTSYVIYQCFFSPLSRIPGPFVGKVTSLYFPFLARRGRLHRDLIQLHKSYGKLVRISPNILSVADPTAFREIYKAGNGFDKAASYSMISGTRPFDLAGQRNEKIHGQQRKLVARAYSMDSMRYLEPHVDLVIKTLIDRMSGLQDQPIDLGHWMQLFAFDIIGAASFSRPFGFVEAGDDGGVFLRIQKAMKSLGWLKHARFVYSAHQRLMPYIGNWLACNDRNTYFYQLATREIQSRTKRDGDYRDVVTQLLSVQKSKPELTDTSIAFMMTSNVFAGSDTTSGTLRAIFYLLLNHPEVYSRLLQELESKRSRGELSYPVTFKEAESCAYLQAVIYEAMRLYPAVGDILDRDVPRGGMMIDGHYVPSGAVVGTSAWVIHRVSEIWGSDAEDFRPDRWLENENESHMKRFFFAFGGGSRTCIGRSKCNHLVPTLLLGFDMKLADNVELEEECW
ncbi:cytochrome P450 [Hypoxylon sp. NC1633]|nr:cytochrome P450 [Hypoxylon sp. NC1633]